MFQTKLLIVVFVWLRTKTCTLGKNFFEKFCKVIVQRANKHLKTFFYPPPPPPKKEKKPWDLTWHFYLYLVSYRARHVLLSSDKIANEKFVTTYAKTTNARVEFEWKKKKKLLRANGRCKAAKKEFTREPAESYKFISLVQARQIGSANVFPTGTNYSDLKRD